jgi:hypothetical protein
MPALDHRSRLHFTRPFVSVDGANGAAEDPRRNFAVNCRSHHLAMTTLPESGRSALAGKIKLTP